MNDVVSNCLAYLGSICLAATVLSGTLGTVILILTGAFSRDSELRASCFGASKGCAIGFLAALLISPFTFANALGFQANINFNSAISFVGLTLLPLVLSVVLAVRGWQDA